MDTLYRDVDEAADNDRENEQQSCVRTEVQLEEPDAHHLDENEWQKQE